MSLDPQAQAVLEMLAASGAPPLQALPVESAEQVLNGRPVPSALYHTEKWSAVLPRYPCIEGLTRCGRRPIPLSNQREHF